jgi:hypothetical protein
MMKWLGINALIVVSSIGAAYAAPALVEACCDCCAALLGCCCD